MRVGTKSILIGAHQFLLHPALVFLAWWKLYGFPADPRLWIAFVIHDLGYWGKPNMDGDEGEAHPKWAAARMRLWFGKEWGDLCLYHSRFYAKEHKRPFSRLCVADKLVIVMEPWWLYLPRVWASGEVHEYMRIAQGKSGSKYGNENRDTSSMRAWHRSMVDYVRAWVAEHQGMKADTWTLAVTPEDAHDPYPWDYADDYADEDDYLDPLLDGWDEADPYDEYEEAMALCSMMPDGYCGQAGSEYCDWDCPVRDWDEEAEDGEVS